MKRNMGTLDRVLRTVVVAPVVIVISLAVFGAGSVLGVVALVFAGVMLATAAVGFCPTYTLFGISTRRRVGAAGQTAAAAQHEALSPDGAGIRSSR
jgi:hypothetical protein